MLTHIVARLTGVLIFGISVCGSVNLATCQDEQSDSPSTDNWISLFNGKDLSGWQAKIKGFPLGQNFANTFRVEDGVLKVAYDNYEDKFQSRFGHLFYKDKFSHYILRVEYRFVGEQIADAPGWANRNSGMMLHCQDPASMDQDQDFPVSIEFQLLGGNGDPAQTRPTANLCTPGTNVEMDNELIQRHCINSKSDTFHGDQWVTVEAEVRGNEIVKHSVNGKVVLQYQHPQLDERDKNAKPLIGDNGLQLSEGYISLQSESHPIEFRKVELKVIK